LEIAKPRVPVGHRPIADLGAARREQEITRAAGAHQISRLEIDEVLVLLGDRDGAHLAPLPRPALRARADETLQDAEIVDRHRL
jgi:hypothetical protein